MKNTGIIRKLDELGRIVLPITLRETLQLKEGDLFEIYVVNDYLIMNKLDTKEKPKGMIYRKLDELGRIVIPIEIRRKYDFLFNDNFEIYIEESSIALKKYKNTCLFCNGTENLIEFKEKLLCLKCIHELNKSTDS